MEGSAFCSFSTLGSGQGYMKGFRYYFHLCCLLGTSESRESYRIYGHIAAMALSLTLAVAPMHRLSNVKRQRWEQKDDRMMLCHPPCG